MRIGTFLQLARFYSARAGLILILLSCVLLLPGCGSASTEKVRTMLAQAEDKPTVTTSETPAAETATEGPETKATPDPSATPEETNWFLELDPAVVMQGNRAEVRASGFAPRETVVFAATRSTLSEPIELHKGRTDRQGWIADQAIRLPRSVGPGTWTLRARGETSGRVAEVQFHVRAPYPRLEIEESRLKQGEGMRVSAVGFDPWESVTLTLQGSPGDPLLVRDVDQGGNLVRSEVEMPVLAPGDYTLSLRSKDGKRRAESKLTVLERAPRIALEAETLVPGRSLSLSGYDFIPGEQVKVMLDWQTNPSLAVVTVSESGSFSLSSVYTPTERAIGRHTLTFSSSRTRQSISVEFEVVPHMPTIQLSAYAGPPGTTVRFNGKGFEPGEIVRVLVGEERHEMANLTADREGAFSSAGEITIPAGVQGNRVVLMVEGDVSRVPVSAEFEVLALEPWASMTSYTGDRGTNVYLEGFGFAPRETIAVYVDDSPEPLAQAKADSSGRVRRVGPFKMPDAYGGRKVEFRLVGESSGAQTAAVFESKANADE